MTNHTAEALTKGQNLCSHLRETQALQVAASLPLKSKSLLEKIILTSSLLNKELRPRGNNREVRLVNTILASAWNLWNEMSAIIDIATLQTEGLHLCLQPVVVNTAIHNVLGQIVPTLHSRQQVLTLKLTPESPMIMADPLRLEQVLLTLLSHVSQSTAEHGSVFTSTAKQGKLVTITIWGDPSAVVENTTDIPHDQAEHKGCRSASDLAIELALSKYLIKLHKGKLWLPSETSHGVAFILALPSADN